MITLVQRETNLKMYMETATYTVQRYLSQRTQKYLNSQLSTVKSITPIGLAIRWDYL